MASFVASMQLYPRPSRAHGQTTHSPQASHRRDKCPGWRHRERSADVGPRHNATAGLPIGDRRRTSPGEAPSNSAPGRSRTRNLTGRNRLLYPVELQGRAPMVLTGVEASAGDGGRGPCIAERHGTRAQSDPTLSSATAIQRTSRRFERGGKKCHHTNRSKPCGPDSVGEPRPSRSRS